MKKLTVVFCLFLSVHALAQSGDTTHKASKTPFTLPYKTDPLIVVDNAVYKGTINSISPSDIQDITILKGQPCHRCLRAGCRRRSCLLSELKNMPMFWRKAALAHKDTSAGYKLRRTGYCTISFQSFDCFRWCDL